MIVSFTCTRTRNHCTTQPQQQQYLHTFSLISAGASRQAECNHAHLNQAGQRQHGHTDIGQGGRDNYIQLDIVNLDSVQAMK